MLPLLLALLAVPAPALASDIGLVLLIAVDQLRPDRLDASMPGGLGRLAREGRVYNDAALEHAMTETCPGHVVMLTGLHPARTGIPANTFIDVSAGRRVYCVEDSAADAAVLAQDADAEGRSPRNLWVPTLGDWMKAADPRSRVYAVAGKDRSAITLGGQRPDGAYWFRRGEPPSFTTSRYYRSALPDWVRAWNGADPPRDGFLAALPERWEHAPGTAGRRVDDFHGESERFERTSPHPVHGSDFEEFGEQLYFSPFLDEATLDFALDLAEREHLGEGEAPDLLAVGLSATDLVGHLYGPYSRESADALARLDAGLGEFLTALEDRVGEGRILIALTADHGVLPLPEWLEAEGRNRCSAPEPRTGIKWLALRLYWQLHRAHAPLLSIPQEWLVIAGTQAAVNRPVAAQRGVSIEAVAETARSHLETLPAVRKVWTAAEIASGEGEFAQLYRNSFIPERSGDLAIQLEPDCLIALEDVGTSHGSPYLYDRGIPLLFHGPGIAAARVPGQASGLDIAPTLAARLGLEAPDGLDGRNLIEDQELGSQSSATPSTAR